MTQKEIRESLSGIVAECVNMENFSDIRETILDFVAENEDVPLGEIDKAYENGFVWSLDAHQPGCLPDGDYGAYPESQNPRRLFIDHFRDVLMPEEGGGDWDEILEKLEAVPEDSFREGFNVSCPDGYILSLGKVSLDEICGANDQQVDFASPKLIGRRVGPAFADAFNAIDSGEIVKEFPDHVKSEFPEWMREDDRWDIAGNITVYSIDLHHPGCLPDGGVTYFYASDADEISDTVKDELNAMEIESVDGIPHGEVLAEGFSMEVDGGQILSIEPHAVEDLCDTLEFWPALANKAETAEKAKAKKQSTPRM